MICWICRELKDKGTTNPPNFYLFQVNNRNTRKRCAICSELTTETLEKDVKYVQS